MTQGGLNGCVSEVGRWGHRGHCQLLCLCTLGCGPAVCGRIRGRGGRHIRQRRAERLPRASVVRGGRSWREVLAGAPDGGSWRVGPLCLGQGLAGNGCAAYCLATGRHWRG